MTETRFADDIDVSASTDDDSFGDSAVLDLEAPRFGVWDQEMKRHAAAQARREAKRDKALRKSELAAQYVTLICSAEIRSTDNAVREAAMRELAKARIRYRFAGGVTAKTYGEDQVVVAEVEEELRAAGLLTDLAD